MENDLDAVRPAHFDHRLQTAADGADILVTEAYERIDTAQLRKGALQAAKFGN